MKNIFLFVCIFALMSNLALKAQVTIGTHEAPLSGALLQLKTINDTASIGEINATQGLAFPRVALVKRDELQPMYSALVAPTLSNNEKIAHKGLVVYNVKEVEKEELSVGLNLWDGEKWVGLEKKRTAATLDITNCARDISVFGVYKNKVPLDGGNVLRITVNVAKPGYYTLTAIADGDNGYFFSTSGEFFSIGTYDITIPGMGTPINYGTDRFTVMINEKAENGTNPPCTFDIEVKNSAIRPRYGMDCSKTILNGEYYEEERLNNSHYIELTLNVEASSYGAEWKIYTNEVDGIKFSGNGTLGSGSPQTVRIYGEGVPFSMRDKEFYITTNSESTTATCKVTVLMIVPPKRVMALSEYEHLDVTYGYNPVRYTTRNPANSFNAMLTEKTNFGPHQWSVVRYSGFNNTGTGTSANFIPPYGAQAPDTWTDDQRDMVGLTMTGWRAMSAATLESFLKGTNGRRKVDVFMIAYTGDQGSAGADYYRTNDASDKAKCEKLIEFVKSGGILMIASEQTVSNNNFLNLMFGSPSPAIGSATGSDAGTNYSFGYNPDNTPFEMRPYYCRDDDPILQGPFDKILGRNWGEDSSYTIYITNLPLDQVVIYSGARGIGYTGTSIPATGVTVFRHREYPFIFVGDGGFNSSETRIYGNSVRVTACPFRLIDKSINGRAFNNYPSFHPNFGGTGIGNKCYNAVFTANAFAWCIGKAEEMRKQSQH